MRWRLPFPQTVSGGADPLRWMVPLALLLGLLGAGTLLAFDLAGSRNRDQAAAQLAAERQIDRLDHQIDAAFDRIDLVLAQAARDAVAPLLAVEQGGGRRQAMRDLQRWASFLPEGSALTVRDAAGTSLGPIEEATGPGVSPELFERLRADPGAGMVVVRAVPTRDAEPERVNLGRAVIGPEGRFLGLIEACLPADYFQSLLTTLSLPPMATVALIDEGLRLVAREPALPTHLGRPLNDPRLRAALAQTLGGGELEGISPLDGVARLFLFRRLETVPYWVLIGRAPAEFLGEWQGRVILYVLAYVLFALVLLALLWLHVQYSADRRHLVAQVFDSAREGILIADRAGRILAVNAALPEITGLSSLELSGRFLADVLDPTEDAGLWAGLQAQGYWRGEVWTRRKSGELYPQWLSVNARRDLSGNITHFIGMVSDLSELEQIRRQAEENHRRLEQAQALAGLGWWEFEPASGRLTWSETTFAILGHDPASFVPSLEAVLPAIEPDDLARLRASCLDRAVTGDRDLLFRIRRSDGALRHVLSRFRIAAGTIAAPERLVGIALDVTEREAIITRLDLFRRIVDASSQGIGIADAEGRILLVNQAFLTMTGYEAAAISGQSYLTLVEDIGAEAVIDREQALAAGESWTGVIGLRRADGSVFPSYSHSGVVRAADGSVQYLFDIFSDFTAEMTRQADLRAARDAAEAASRAKSVFLANMSHELRTPMNAILGFSQFIMMDSTLTPVQRERVEAIFQAGNHLLDLINGILDLARVESGRFDLELDMIPLVPVIRDCIELIQPLAAKRGITVELTGAADLTVRSDRLRLRQVLVNLLSNAVKYNRPDGNVRIGLGADLAGRVRVTIADTGPGIAPERLSELFTPFNRLGAEVSGIEGTGIGLALTRRILEAMHGKVGVESRPGFGTLFWIDLPSG